MEERLLIDCSRVFGLWAEGLYGIDGHELVRAVVWVFDEAGCKHLYSGTGQEGIHLLSNSEIVKPYQLLYIY